MLFVSLILSNTEQNCLFNIAGYIISRVKKNEKICFEFLDSKNRVNADYKKFVTEVLSQSLGISFCCGLSTKQKECIVLPKDFFKN